MLDFVNKHRDQGVVQMKILETSNVILFTPECIETLLGSSELITKSKEYRFLHHWLGYSILVRSGPAPFR